MAIIVTQTADNASHIRDAFRRFGRDCYPYGVYEAIYNYIQEMYGEEEAYELDVTAWCCVISETAVERKKGKDDDEDEVDPYALADLAADLERHTTVLYVDEDDGIVYHLAY